MVVEGPTGAAERGRTRLANWMRPVNSIENPFLICLALLTGGGGHGQGSAGAAGRGEAGLAAGRLPALRGAGAGDRAGVHPPRRVPPHQRERATFSQQTNSPAFRCQRALSSQAESAAIRCDQFLCQGLPIPQEA